jgi:hypothetical protein
MTARARQNADGTGKTTTVRILAALLLPSAGRAIEAGYDVIERPMAVRASIGLTAHAAVDLSLTRRQNLELIGNLSGISRPDRPSRADKLPGGESRAASADSRNSTSRPAQQTHRGAGSRRWASGNRGTRALLRQGTWSGGRTSRRPLSARPSRRQGLPSTLRSSAMSCRFTSATLELSTPGSGSRSRQACGTASLSDGGGWRVQRPCS